MNYEYFFLKRLPGRQPQIIRAMAPNISKAAAMIAEHLGCTEGDRKAIQKYLSRRGIREAEVQNVIREKMD